MLYLYLLLQVIIIGAIPEWITGDDRSINSAYLGSLPPSLQIYRQNNRGLQTRTFIIQFPSPFSQTPQVILSVMNGEAVSGFRANPKAISRTSFNIEYTFSFFGIYQCFVKYMALVDDNIWIDNIEQDNLPNNPIFQSTILIRKNFPQIPNAIIFLNGFDYLLIHSNLDIDVSITDISLTQYNYRVVSTNQLTYFTVVVILGISPYFDFGTQSGTPATYALGQYTLYDYFLLQGLSGVKIDGNHLSYTLQKVFDPQMCVMNLQLQTGLTQNPSEFKYSYFFYRPCGWDYYCSNRLKSGNSQQCSIKKYGCALSYYADLSVNKCLRCSNNCNICATLSTNCITCANPLNSLPLCVCGVHQYLDANIQCQECPNSCLQCNDSQCIGCATNCSSCNYYTCLTCIANNYYILNGLCVQCPDGCFTCNSTQCLSCNNPLQLINGNCILNCELFCLTCNLQSCLQCITGYFPASTSCAQCDNKCVTCISSSICLSCDSTKFRRLNQYNECTCIDGYIENKNICIQVDSVKSQELQILNCAQIVINNNNQQTCIKCIAGYFKINNTCQQCELKCLDCLTEINICTTCRFSIPINDQQDCQLCEYQPGYYSDYNTNKCTTICGDGIIAGNEQCDDYLQSIGCQNCQPINNYICNQFECELIIYPFPNLIEISDSFQIYNNTKIFLLSYNVELSSFDLNVTIQLSDQSISYTYELISINQLCYIQLSLLNTSISQNLTIFFHNSNIQTLIGQQQQRQFITIKISDYIAISYITDMAVSGISQGINIMLILILVLIGISILFGGLEIYWNILDLLQRISYLKYINTIFPYNMTQIIQLFSYVQLSNLPYMEQLTLQFIPNYPISVQPPYSIANDGYTCSIYQNLLPIVFPWLISVCVFFFANLLYSPVLYMVTSLQLKLSMKIVKLLRYFYNQLLIINHQWIWSGMLRLYQSSAYDICFTLTLGLYGISSLQDNEQYLTYILIIVHLSVIYACFQITSRKIQTLKKLENKYGAVIEGLKLKQNTIMFNNLTFLKKGLFMVSLVLVYQQPLFQISSILLIQLYQILRLVYLCPLKNRVEYSKQILCEALMTFQEILINLLVVDDQLGLFTHDKRELIGWIWISCILTIILTQILIDTIQQIAIFKKQKRSFNIEKFQI